MGESPRGTYYLYQWKTLFSPKYRRYDKQPYFDRHWLVNDCFYITMTCRDRVLEIEKKFKQDILLEASKNQSMIMVNDEDEKYRITMRLVPVSTSTVSTVFFYIQYDRVVGGGIQSCK